MIKNNQMQSKSLDRLDLKILGELQTNSRITNTELAQKIVYVQPSSEFKNVNRSARSLRRKLEYNGLVAADLFLQLALDYQSRAVNNPRPAIRRKARDAC